MEIMQRGHSNIIGVLEYSTKIYLTEQEIKQGYVTDVFRPERGSGRAYHKKINKMSLSELETICIMNKYQLVLPKNSTQEKDYELGNPNILWK